MTDLFTTDEETAPVSDRTITADLMGRLERHYIKPGQPLPGGVFVPEVGENGGWGTGRRCDAIYVGFTSASGRMLVGHEVKASRADWLTELSKPGKADAWADQCHEWWLVTVPGVVKDGELPAGWGLMVPGTSKTRMKVITAARRHVDRTPSWDAVRSIVARQDTLRAAAILDGRMKAVEDARADVALQVEQRVESRMLNQPDAAVLAARLKSIETALGGSLVPDDARHTWDGQFRASDLADLRVLLDLHDTLEEAARSLHARYALRELDRLREAIDSVQAAHEAVLASLPKRSVVTA